VTRGRSADSLRAMRVLIIGGTGKVGAPMVRALEALGVEAVAAARHAAPITLDLHDTAAVEAAARGFDAAFFITPLGQDETDVGLAVHAALIAAGVERIGYLAIHNLDAMRAIPHFETKRPIRDAVLGRNGGVVIAPNFFFQNDLLAINAMRFGGVYPLPVGETGVYSVDAGDIGAAAANALASGDFDGTMVPVCGDERLTGPLLAANWAAALGRDVAYGGNDARAFVAMLQGMMPPDAKMSDWFADDMRIMMEVTQAMGCLATDADIATSRAAIGRAPKRHADFAKEHAG
jgi:uncharacterized protein YbjT (DUF2867 family)